MKDTIRYFVVLMIYIIVIGCDQNDRETSDDVIKIDFENIKASNSVGTSSDSVQVLKLAIASMTSPKETYKHYQDLIKYLSDSLSLRIELLQKKTYDEVNKLLRNDRVDIAFICSGSYVAAVENFPLDIVVIPMINKIPFYHSYIITHKDLKIKSFNELRGRSFAYTDPLSNTGYLYGLYLLKKNNFSEENYFSKTIFTNAHDLSIQAVARKIVDGACVHGSIYDYIKQNYPDRVKNIRIINISEPFGMPPIVARSSFNGQIKSRIKEILINMDKNIRGRDILDQLLIDKYVDADSTDYSSVRNCIEFLRK